MSIINEFIHIAQWCEDYFDKTKIKTYPSNPPVIHLIEHLLEEIAALKKQVEDKSSKHNEAKEEKKTKKKILKAEKTIEIEKDK